MAALLVTALLLLCLGDLVEAAAPAMDGAPCATRLCSEQTGCGTALAKPALLPVTTHATPIILLPPATTSTPADFLAPAAPRDRQIVPQAPRSPPAA
jgi:hypothetical protein